MSTNKTQNFEHNEQIVTNMFRYVYWVSLNKETAMQVVSSTLNQLPKQYLQNPDYSQHEKLEVLKFLQNEFKKNTSPTKKSYKKIFSNFVENQNYYSGTKSGVQSMRAKLQSISEIDRAIFVLIYLWEINLSQAAEILQIPEQRVKQGFDETLKALQAVLPGN